VLATLAERFLERARGHFRADRFTEAMMDLDRAEAGGVLKEEISELRGQVRTVASEVHRRDQSRRERVDAAQRRVESGSLEAGRRILEHADEKDPAVARARREVERRMTEVTRLVEQAEQLLTQDNLAAAADRVCRALALDGSNEAVSRVEARVCAQVCERARQALAEGRLSRAADELACLGSLGRKSPLCRELADALALARAASAAMSANDFAEARRQMMSLLRLVPRAAWAEESVEQLRKVEEVRMALATGPLGDRVRVEVRGPQGPRSPIVRAVDGLVPAKRPLDDTVIMPARSSEGAMQDRLLLLVDGGGSYLILRGGRAAIGRAAAEHPAEIPLISDVGERHANIERVDEDYFLFSAKEVEIGGRPTRHQLLRDGDRITLGRKAKLTFRMPSRRSPSAVLDLSDTTKMPHDVRRVVLFHQHLTIGDGPHAHVRCRHAGPSLLMVERNGELWVRQRNDGHVDTEARPLKLGEPVEIGGACLVLSPWRGASSGGIGV